MKNKNISLAVVCTIIVVSFISFACGLKGIENNDVLKGKEELELSLRRAAAACYAAEGIYPADVSYLEQHFGVRIDKDRFVVKYDAFASNIMPDIIVLDVAYEK